MPINSKLRTFAKQVRDQGASSLDHEDAMALIRFAAGFILDPARGSAVTHTKVTQKLLQTFAAQIAGAVQAGYFPQTATQLRAVEGADTKLAEACRLLNGDFHELVAKPPKK